METLNGTLKKCPFCAEEILADALKCKHCGEWLNHKHKFDCEVLDGNRRKIHWCFEGNDPTSVENHIKKLDWELISIKKRETRPSGKRKFTGIFGSIALATYLMSHFIPAITTPIVLLVAVACSILEMFLGSAVYGIIVLTLSVIQIFSVAGHFSNISRELEEVRSGLSEI